MEIKLDIQKKAAGKVPVIDTGNAARAAAPETIAQKSAAPDTREKPQKVKRICVLHCGTVMLQNFTEDLNEPGRQLMLVREPDNAYDRWAIKVCTLTGVMLGYLPSGKNQSVARLMDAGKNITVFVAETLNIPEPPPYRPVNENELLPLVLYMDIAVPEENEE